MVQKIKIKNLYDFIYLYKIIFNTIICINKIFIFIISINNQT
jgi:hypothetical protein